MKVILLQLLLMAYLPLASAQIADALKGKEIFKNDDVVFHQIDEHTWVGTGHEMYNESMYLLEGNEKAVLIDAGTNIKDLHRIIDSITGKPVMLVATHVHPDHTGSAIDYFPEIYINPADTVQLRIFMPNYKGKISILKNGEIIDLGGRSLHVLFTPAHTPGSTTFIDTNAGYGFSGDSFGSGNLLLSSTFSELIATCEKTGTFMDKNNIAFFYPGHYFGNNPETRQRINDMITLSKDVLSGKLKGETNSNGMMGLNKIVSSFGVRINYNEKSVR
jgi:glyoxylase-like metal-dependent hydrolase (beta-lactamase superfamily II)